MMTAEEMGKLGNDLLGLFFTTEVKEYDKFMPEHQIEFKLQVLEIVYSVRITPDQLDDEAVRNIWTQLFSDFAAHFNLGLLRKDSLKEAAEK